MPTHLDEAIKIILSPSSKLRDKTPRIYQLPEEKNMPKQFTNLKRMRFLNHDVSAGRNIKRWLWRDYNPEIVLQVPPFDKYDDQSEIFTLIRQPDDRWWSGIKDMFYFMPYYTWWTNEEIMQQWPHFTRGTLRLHDVMEEVKPTHLIKCDDGLNDRIIQFAKTHGLLCYGNIPHEKALRHSKPDIKKLEDLGVKELKAWLRKNPNRQKQLEEYLDPDWQYWEQVEYQD
jgi:hypothetical protein|tara:strand:- start:751 stop:1434 length:684 start_codon:yes stop_codon:yes gene_type:complete